jgi:hypothetical protein
MEFPGCFRCHDGKHVDDDGKAISKDCSSCHEFLTPEKTEGGEALVLGGSFVHPVELKGEHASMLCDKCHGRPARLDRTCAGCHVDVSAFLGGDSAAFKSFDIPAGEMDGFADCEDCHDLDKPTNLPTITKACLVCHDASDGYDTILAQWKSELDKLFAAAARNKTAAAQQTIQALRQAGPMHNMGGSRIILEALAAEAAVQAGKTGTAGAAKTKEPGAAL